MRLQCSRRARLGDQDVVSVSKTKRTKWQEQSLSERLEGLMCGLLDLQVFYTFFLFLTVFGMPHKWLAGV